MDLYYLDNELYVEVSDRLNMSFVRKLKRKLNVILEHYFIGKVNIIFLNDSWYNRDLLNDMIGEFDEKYNCVFVVK